LEIFPGYIIFFSRIKQNALKMLGVHMAFGKKYCVFHLYLQKEPYFGKTWQCHHRESLMGKTMPCRRRESLMSKNLATSPPQTAHEFVFSFTPPPSKIHEN